VLSLSFHFSIDHQQKLDIHQYILNLCSLLLMSPEGKAWRENKLLPCLELAPAGLAFLADENLPSSLILAMNQQQCILCLGTQI
jgi:hypothetical protein